VRTPSKGLWRVTVARAWRRNRSWMVSDVRVANGALMFKSVEGEEHALMLRPGDHVAVRTIVEPPRPTPQEEEERERRVAAPALADRMPRPEV